LTEVLSDTTSVLVSQLSFLQVTSTLWLAPSAIDGTTNPNTASTIAHLIFIWKPLHLSVLKQIARPQVEQNAGCFVKQTPASQSPKPSANY
jgi:hypothetical protein